MPSEGWNTAPNPVPFDQATRGLRPGQSALLPRLARRLINLRPMRWKTLASFAKRGLDVVDVETTVQCLYDAAWLEIRYKADRRGEPTPRELRLRDSAVDDAAALIGSESPSQRARHISALVDGLRERASQGAHLAPVPERVIVRRLFGNTKAVRVRDYRSEIEGALGVPLESLVRFHVDVVLTAGPVRYTFDGVTTDLRGSAPWAAVTQPVVEAATAVHVDGVDELVCIENQTAFESLLYEGLGRTAVVMFTAGYLGTVERLWVAHLVRSGIRRVRHWGDMDPWGLDIYRDLAEHVRHIDPSVAVSPWRMEPELLDRADTQAMTTEDWVKVHRYLKIDGAPLKDCAEAMKRTGRKLEQEALLEG